MEQYATEADGCAEIGMTLSADWDVATVEQLERAGGSLRIESLVARLRDEEADPAPFPEITATYERLVADVLPKLVRDGRVAYAPEDRRLALSIDGSSPPRSEFEPGMGASLLVVTSLFLGVGPLGGPGLGVGLGLAAIVGTSAYLLRGDDPEAGPAPDESAARTARRRPLSPEYQLLERLLADGGVVEQCTLADRLDCSKSTVSRRLSRLQANGLVRKVPVGRKKVVFLRGVAPAGERE